MWGHSACAGCSKHSRNPLSEQWPQSTPCTSHLIVLHPSKANRGIQRLDPTARLPFPARRTQLSTGALCNAEAASIVSGSPPQGPHSSASALETQLSHLEGKLKVVGLGPRGAAGVERLLGGGRLTGAELWVLDAERHQMEGVSSILLKPDHQSLSEEDAARVVGQGAADKDGRGNINVGDGGVTFLLASTGALPGGSELVLSLASRLRAAGHFTVAALTRPFGFEGARKLEAADKLIAELEQIAHLVVVVEQDVLTQSFGGETMTVAEATLIADNALEHTVRCILDALLASEILKSTKGAHGSQGLRHAPRYVGALAWHGKDLRHYRRLLSPPLQRLLSCPGTAALGRGVAVMPATRVRQVGTSSALMHLASDAVRAAAESPFLEASIGRASAVLCCLSLPPALTPRLAGAPGASSSGGSNRGSFDAERHAARMAVQAAAGALMSLTAGICDDIVMSSHTRLPGDNVDNDDGISTRVEVSMLVLRLPEGALLPEPSGVLPPPTTSTLPPRTRSSAAGQPPVPVSSTPLRRSSSNWTAMSALAGGASTARSKAGVPPQQPLVQAAPAATAKATQRVPISAAAFFSPPAAARSQPPSTSVPAAVQSPTEARRSLSWRPPVAGRAAAGPRAAHSAAAVEAPSGKAFSVSSFPEESLTAESLDLPPQAAKWRQQQRGPGFKQRRLVVWEAAADDAESDEDEAGGMAEGLRSLLTGVRRKPVHVRDRTSGILRADRSEGESEGTSAPNLSTSPGLAGLDRARS